VTGSAVGQDECQPGSAEVAQEGSSDRLAQGDEPPRDVTAHSGHAESSLLPPVFRYPMVGNILGQRKRIVFFGTEWTGQWRSQCRRPRSETPAATAPVTAPATAPTTRPARAALRPVR
jgi:hypothetical protein